MLIARNEDALKRLCEEIDEAGGRAGAQPLVFGANCIKLSDDGTTPLERDRGWATGCQFGLGGEIDAKELSGHRLRSPADDRRHRQVARGY